MTILESSPVADLLAGTPDLLAHCFSLLQQQRASSLGVAVQRPARKLEVTAAGLTQVDVLFDGHPGGSHSLNPRPGVTLEYPAGTKVVELIGFHGEDVLQRRRVVLRR